MSYANLFVLTAAVIHTCYAVITKLLELYDTYTKNELDYPPGANAYYHPFNEPLHCPCQIGAHGVFSILTGISISKRELLGAPTIRHEFDSVERPVMYYEFCWKDWVASDRGTKVTQFHAFVYHDGYLYQSYRTSRNWWTNWTDGYPLIRSKLSPEDITIFEDDNSKMTPAIFNRLCAPRTHPIPLGVTLRCTGLFEARVAPTRDRVLFSIPDVQRVVDKSPVRGTNKT